jgi:hypothetical protein
LEGAFNKIPKYHTKILFEEFSADVGKEEIFKPTIRNESLHEISNSNEARIVNIATSKNITVRSRAFTHCSIHKYNSTHPDGKPHIKTDN